jgi:hypothetical protein
MLEHEISLGSVSKRSKLSITPSIVPAARRKGNRSPPTPSGQTFLSANQAHPAATLPAGAYLLGKAPFTAQSAMRN